MADNKLVNSIDLDLSNAEIKSLLSDITFSLAFVVDVNHDGDTGNDLNIGEIRAKSLDLAGTSELSDGVYKPVNSNINQYPLAGEFVITLETPLGRFYLSPVNLFNDKSNNIDIDNIRGYVTFTDDENINQQTIKSDKSGQKSVLENNKEPFNEQPINVGGSYQNKFGDISFDGRYGNKITLSKADNNLPEMYFDNDNTTIKLTNGSFSYLTESTNAPIPANVNSVVTSQYNGEQIYGNSSRIFLSAGDKGMFSETSGVMSFVSDKNMYLTTGNDLKIEGTFIDLGSGANEAVVLGDTFMDDFNELVDSMVRFAKTLKKQDRILSLSNAANNFLTDIRMLGWDNFQKSSYLSKKVYTE